MRGENEKFFPNSSINTNSVLFAKIEKEKSRFTRSIYRKKTEMNGTYKVQMGGI